MRISDVLSTFLQDLRRSNPDAPSSVLEKFEGKIRERIEQEPPPRIALIGDTGVGKSSTLNALFNAGQEVGHTKATTISEYGISVKLGPVQAQRGELIVYDMPGLNESLRMRGQHLATYARVLADVDVALWVLEAHYRPMEQVQSFLTKDMRRINPDLVDRVVFALNKVDLVHPGQTAWHPLACLPSAEQQRNIDDRIKDVHRLVLEALPGWHGTVIGYSASERYNLPQLFAVMLDAVGKKRQWVIAEHKALADYFERVHPSLLPPDRWPANSSRKPGRTGPDHEDVRGALLSMSEEELQDLLAERRQRGEGSGDAGSLGDSNGKRNDL
jgi:predicted GTPase